MNELIEMFGSLSPRYSHFPPNPRIRIRIRIRTRLHRPRTGSTGYGRFPTTLLLSYP